MELHKAQLESVGLQVIAISMGEPKHAQRYCGRFAPHIDCLVDNSTRAYDAYGLSRGGTKEFLTLNNALRFSELAAQGIFIGETIGDPLMMPGFFIVDQNGVVRYTYYAKEASDHPEMADVIRAAQSSAAQG